MKAENSATRLAAMKAAMSVALLGSLLVLVDAGKEKHEP
jgi:hypothetical protein